jgi:hypothetical protein
MPIDHRTTRSALQGSDHLTLNLRHSNPEHMATTGLVFFRQAVYEFHGGNGKVDLPPVYVAGGKASNAIRIPAYGGRALWIVTKRLAKGPLR